MRCTSCDHLLPEDARVCPSCGAEVRAADLDAAPTERLTPPPAPVVAEASAPAQPAAAQLTPPPAPSASVAPAPAAAAMPIGLTPAVASAVGAPVQQVNVTVQTTPTPVLVMGQTASGPGCLVRGLYFLFVGWWLSQVWIWVAWVLNLTVLGLPLGLMMLNRLPQVVTLKPPRAQAQVTIQHGAVVIGQAQLAQRPFWLRAIYFALLGWWLSLAWVQIAWLATLSVVGLPLAFWMFDRVPAITTLARR